MRGFKHLTRRAAATALAVMVAASALSSSAGSSLEVYAVEEQEDNLNTASAGAEGSGAGTVDTTGSENEAAQNPGDNDGSEEESNTGDSNTDDSNVDDSDSGTDTDTDTDADTESDADTNEDTGSDTSDTSTDADTDTDSDEDANDDTDDSDTDDTEDNDDESDDESGIAVVDLNGGGQQNQQGQDSTTRVDSDGYYYHIDIRVVGEFDYVVPSSQSTYDSVTVSKEWSDYSENSHDSDSVTYNLTDESGNTIYSGTLSSGKSWSDTIDSTNNSTVDFSSIAGVTENSVTGYSATYSGPSTVVEGGIDEDGLTAGTYYVVLTVTTINYVSYINESGKTVYLDVDLYTKQTAETNNDGYTEEFFYDSDNENNGRRLSGLLVEDFEIYINLTYSYTLYSDSDHTQEVDSGEVTDTFVYDENSKNTCGVVNGTDSVNDPTEYGFDAAITSDDFKTSLATVSTYKTFTITNTPETTEVTVTKVWNDNNNEYGLRPGSITVELYQNGTATGKTGTISASEDGTWSTYTFEQLTPYDENGDAYNYTVVETAVTGYKTTYSEVTGSVSDGYQVTVTNTLETVDIPVTKVWNDNNDKYGLRPSSISLTLTGTDSDGSTVVTKTATATGTGSSWSYTFEDLPKYDSSGTEITYTVSEDNVTGYTTTVDGTTITNTLQTTSVTVTKEWSGDSDYSDLRPSSITLTLTGTDSDGSTVVTKTATATGTGSSWSYTFTDLPKYDSSGAEISYSVTEGTVTGYTTTVSGTTITNTLQTTEISVTKVWAVAKEYEYLIPDEITFYLLADGVKVDSITLKLSADNADEDGEWVGTFLDLPVYGVNDDGETTKITYTIEEETPTGFTGEITGSADAGYVVTNTLQTTQITVSKVWEDDDDYYSIRPDSVTVYVYADNLGTADEEDADNTDDTDSTDETGTLIKTLTLSADNEWTETLTGLPVYNEYGEQVTYRIAENTESIQNQYSTTYDEETAATEETNKETDEEEAVETEETDETEETKETSEDSEALYYEIVAEADGSYGIIITNTLKTVRIEFEKVWKDDETEHDPITVYLTVNGQPQDDQSVTLSEDNSWAGSFEDLLQYDTDGTEMQYSVVEAEVAGYSSVTTGSMEKGYVITNTRESVTNITVTKEWIDSEGEEKYRPDSVTVKLLANEEETGQTLILSDENDWTATFEDLDEYDEDGIQISYSVEEVELDGYADMVTGSGTEGITVTNTRIIIEIPVEKFWANEGDYEDTLRPDSITIRLYENGDPCDKTLTLSEENDWSGTFSGLRKYDDDRELITYTIAEESSAADEDAEEDVKEDAEEDESDEADEDETANSGSAYKVSITGSASAGFVVTNTLVTTEVSVDKVWEDEENANLLRPASITIRLLADGEEKDSVTLPTEDGSWEWTFEDLAKYNEDGEEIEYTVTEDTVTGYTSSKITGSAADGYTVTNTLITTDIPVEKVWSDESDEFDAADLPSVTINLYGSVNDTQVITRSLTLPTESGNWKDTFENLPVTDADGNEITYTIKEVSVSGYSSVISGSAEDGYTVTNTPNTEVKVTKVWNDGAADHTDDSITITLYKTVTDGAGDETTSEADTLTLPTSDGAWSGTFTDLPVYNQDGNAITYSVEETDVSITGYTSTMTGSAEDGYTFTNTLLTSLTVTKSWVDKDNERQCPKVTVKLYENGEDTSQEQTLSEENGWTATFDNLEAYDDDGNKIEYTVKETEIPTGYEAEYSSASGSAADDYQIEITNTLKTTDITVTKDWEDFDNEYNLRPTSITVTLYQTVTDDTGSAVTTQAGTLTLPIDGVWSGTFENLPLYDTEGREIEYTVTETSVTGYTTTYSVDAAADDAGESDESEESADESDESGETADADESEETADDSGEEASDGSEAMTADNADADGDHEVVITNTLETVSVPFSKVWNDSDNQYSTRPESITVYLYRRDADGNLQLDHYADAIVLSDENDWSGEFTDLAKYNSDGQEITYAVIEASITGYSGEVEEDGNGGYIITNTYPARTTEVSVEKVWDDQAGEENLCAASVTVKLYADGVFKDSAELSESNDWSYVFTDLPEENADGTVIAYTVEEVEIAGYDALVTGDAVHGFTITNTRNTTEIPVQKVWANEGDYGESLRPESVTVRLYENGESTETAVVLSEENSWQSTITDLPRYADDKTEIEYTLVEESAAGYTTTITGSREAGFTVTNTLSTVDIPVQKIWSDDDDACRMRPASVTVRLLADGVETGDELVLSADNSWEGAFEHLRQYDEDGNEIVYTVTEDTVNGYTSAVTGSASEGFAVTNSLVTVEFPVLKFWDDEGDKDGIRPEQITVRLYADGADTGEILILSARNGWQGTFEGLPKYDSSGKTISYTIAEGYVAGYTAAITVNAEEGFYAITNSHEPDVPGGGDSGDSGDPDPEDSGDPDDSPEDPSEVSPEDSLEGSGEEAASLLSELEAGGEDAASRTSTGLTGDDSNPLFWLILALLSAGALAGVIIYLKRRQS